MKRRVTKFDEIAKRVLDYYELIEPRIAFIRHNDNVTYRVTTSNSKAYLLRIHIPITSAIGTHGADYKMVNSEVTWMLALAQETNLTIPKPKRNRSGELVTRIQGGDGATINSTLLSWIEGEPYHKDLESNDTEYLGKVVIEEDEDEPTYAEVIIDTYAKEDVKTPYTAGEGI